MLTNITAPDSYHAFKMLSTDNIMDYKSISYNQLGINKTLTNENKLQTFWKWQWEEMHKDTQDLEPA